MITNDYMSSEESGEDDSIIVHPLPWRSEYVSSMFKRIDAYCEKKKSPQAKRQMKQRIQGRASSRRQPVVDEMMSGGLLFDSPTKPRTKNCYTPHYVIIYLFDRNY